MPLKTERKNIDGHDVAVTQFAGRKNLSLLVELAAFAGPAIAKAIPKEAKSKEEVLDSSIDIAGVVNELVVNMTQDKVDGLVRRMLASTFVSDRPLDDAEFDRIFAGEGIWTLPKILRFVIDVNYGNFSALAGTVSALRGQ